jgi:hypothetical protein
MTQEPLERGTLRGGVGYRAASLVQVGNPQAMVRTVHRAVGRARRSRRLSLTG